MSVLRLLLLPFAFLYDLVTRVRNYMYDTGWKPSASFDLPVISVGNLSAGGTGKTPMIEYLVNVLSTNYQVCTLSRGYGRKTKGFRIAGPADDASTIGDEPLQLYRKFGQTLTVAVGEERALAIPTLLDQFPDTSIILLDDAFQHRKVRPGFSILLTDYSRMFYDDYLLPAGRLREHPKGADRADVVVVTKCPASLDHAQMNSIHQRISRYTRKPVYFSTIRYGAPLPMFQREHPLHTRIVLVSGIAQHTALEDYVKEKFTLVHHVVFRDHHAYTKQDVERLRDYLRSLAGPATLLTTEKDRVKLEREEWRELLAELSVYYLPIQVEFLQNGKEFDNHVREFVNCA
jgi:tetraacyldisaccharide 4'-kinase